MKMFTTVMTTLQITTSATTISTCYRNDADHRDDDDNDYVDNSKDNNNENDNSGYKNDLNNDLNDENNQECVDDLFNINNNIEDEDCYKNQADDNYSDINACHYNDCHEDCYGYCLSRRKVDYNSRRNDYNVRVKLYRNGIVHYRNNRDDEYGGFFVTDCFYDDEHFNDIKEDSETDTDSEKCDNADDEDSSLGYHKIVNYTYTDSDGDYTCRDKQCCYQSDEECTDDVNYYNGQELDVVHDSDDDDSDIDENRDDQGYNDDLYSDYDNYSEGGLSDSYLYLLNYSPSEVDFYSGWGNVSDDLSDPYDDPNHDEYDCLDDHDSYNDYDGDYGDSDDDHYVLQVLYCCFNV